MRVGMFALLLACSSAAHAQQDIWQEVRTHYERPEFTPFAVSGSQLHAIAALLKRHGEFGGWDCDPDQIDQVVKGFKFENVPLTPGRNVLLAQADAGCARGAQGSNGAMWLIRLDGKKPVVIASPRHGFSGFIYSIQDASSHGYRDIVLGWHMGAAEMTLNYIRFDGISYRPVGAASLTLDDNDKGTLVPISR